MARARPATHIELNRALLCEMFQSKYEILEAEDGKSALHIIEKEKENLAIVLLDVVMPIMDGFSVLEIMNEKGWVDCVPVIMITAEVSDNVMGNGYELGTMDIINKPFNPNIVNKRVENIIENFAYKNSLEQMVENQARKIREQSERLHENNLRLIDALSSIIEFKNTESAQHVFNIRIITKMLLNKLAASPGATSRRNSKPSVSSATLSEATIYSVRPSPISRLPSTSGRMPFGSRKATMP